MRDHTKAFCAIAAESFETPGPVVEFGAYQVEGQGGYADLRRYFPGREYVGCDMRPGPGVDRVEDVTRPSFADGSVGVVLCVETFEHVYEVHRAFDEVYRILRPGGMFAVTSPFYFKIHGYPDDYWRMTPSCLRRRMESYEARVCGWQGWETTPHTVMALGFKAPAPLDFHERADVFLTRYREWLEEARKASRRGGSWAERARRLIDPLRLSKGERRRMAHYFDARFHVDADLDATAILERARREAAKSMRELAGVAGDAPARWFDPAAKAHADAEVEADPAPAPAPARRD